MLLMRLCTMPRVLCMKYPHKQTNMFSHLYNFVIVDNTHKHKSLWRKNRLFYTYKGMFLSKRPLSKWHEIVVY